MIKSACFSYMLANARNSHHSLWWSAYLLPNHIGPQCCTKQNHLARKTWVTTPTYLMVITVLMSKHFVWSVLCLEEEIFNTLGNGLGLRLGQLHLSPWEDDRATCLGNNFQTDKGHEDSQPIIMQRKLCWGSHHLLEDDQFSGFCLSNGYCLPWP